MKMLKTAPAIAFFCAILILLCGRISAEPCTQGSSSSTDISAGSNDETEGEDERKRLSCCGWSRLGYDMKYIFTSPARFDKEDLQNALIFVGMTGALFAERKDIREIVLRNKTDSRMNLYEKARISSKGFFSPALALLFFASGKARGSDYDVETGQIIMESMFASAVATGVGSFIIASERPVDGDGVRFFKTNGHGVSLDVALSSSFVFPIIDRYLKVRESDGAGRKFIKRTSQVLIFSLPVLTALQRMSADKHWAPDVFLGASAGLAAGKILSNAHRSDQRSRIECTVSGGMITMRF